MKVTIRYFTFLREITQKREEEVDLPTDGTLEELLKVLSKNYGQQFTDYVFNERGEVQSRFHFLVNGKSITALNGLKTKLMEGDKVAIVPPVGGGTIFGIDVYLFTALEREACRRWKVVEEVQKPKSNDGGGFSFPVRVAFTWVTDAKTNQRMHWG